MKRSFLFLDGVDTALQNIIANSRTTEQPNFNETHDMMMMMRCDDLYQTSRYSIVQVFAVSSFEKQGTAFGSVSHELGG